MSGRQVRTKPVFGTLEFLLGWAQEIVLDLGRQADIPAEIRAVQWPELPMFPREDTFIGGILDNRVTEVTGTITDFKPRKGKVLQRWKLAENAAELCEVVGSGVRVHVDRLEESKELVDADEELGLKEQLDKMNLITEFQELLQSFQESCEDCAATIRAVEIPNRR